MAIGDVAGKGISAALLMASLQSAMRSAIAALRGVVTGRGDLDRATGLESQQSTSRFNLAGEVRDVFL